jgi:hypothetical protein
MAAYKVARNYLAKGQSALTQLESIPAITRIYVADKPTHGASGYGIGQLDWENKEFTDTNGDGIQQDDEKFTSIERIGLQHGLIE